MREQRFEITLSPDLIEASAGHEGAFVEAFRREMDAAVVDGWVDFLRWMRMSFYGEPLDMDAIRAEARRRAAAGQVPPWPDAFPE